MSSTVVEIGSRLELLVDEALIASTHRGARLELHHPVRQSDAYSTDGPAEGNRCGYITVLRDAGRYLLYFRARTLEPTRAQPGKLPPEPHPLWVALIDSSDGIHWHRPDLGLVEFQGSKRNNVVWQGAGPDGLGVHGFTPFIDTNPACHPEQRFKAVGGARGATKGHLHAMQSADGIHWSLLQEGPVIIDGKFDSQNLAFWDGVRGKYRAYIRDFRGGHPEGSRDIRTAISTDFIHWSTPEWLSYPGAPDEQLYTNQVQPYYRAPHLFIGFPSRYVEREWGPEIDDLPEVEHRRLRSRAKPRFGPALTEGLFMSSRDGRTFQRWGEAFIRPGPQLQGNWTYGDNYQSIGWVETPSAIEGAPDELSFYASGTAGVIRRPGSAVSPCGWMASSR